MNRILEKRVNQILEDSRQPINSVMAFYGAGNHGGAEKNIKSIEELKRSDAPKLFFSTIDRYFEELKTQTIQNCLL